MILPLKAVVQRKSVVKCGADRAKHRNLMWQAKFPFGTRQMFQLIKSAKNRSV